MRINRRALLASTVGAVAVLATKASASTEPFRLGAMPPLTGAGGEYGGNMLTAIQMAVERVNALEPSGAPLIELFVEDDQTRAEAAVLAAKKLIEVNRVQAICGIWPAASQLAIMPMTNAAGVVTCNFAGATEVLTHDKDDLAFQFTNYNEKLGAVMANVAVKQGFKQPSILAYNNATMMAMGRAFEKNWHELTANVAPFTQYEPAQSSYRTEVDNALQINPDLLVIGGYAPDTSIILKEWYATGAELKFMCPSWSLTEETAERLGSEISKDAIILTSIPAQSEETYAEFSAAFKDRTGVQPDLFASSCYDEVMIIALAIKFARSTRIIGKELSSSMRAVSSPPGTLVGSYEEAIDMIEKGEEIDYNGAGSNLDFDEYGQVYPDVGVYTYRDGVLILDDVVKQTI